MTLLVVWSLTRPFLVVTLKQLVSFQDDVVINLKHHSYFKWIKNEA